MWTNPIHANKPEQKPLLKTIEVVDSRTGNACKVACMSCIRGHRTTSCGKPVCRNKLFWTVKRPGRPTNACTCPLGSTGRCRCAIATSACPHRSKKGEGRSVDCRCDEQGRWCCVLDGHHWTALIDQQNPSVDFYPSPEAMNAARMPSTNGSFPSTPSYSAGTPQTMSSLPNTPDPLPGVQPTNIAISPQNKHQPTAYQPPRFGFMGIGTPLGDEGHLGEDVLTWEGQAPQAPREFPPYPGADPLYQGGMQPSIPLESITQPSYTGSVPAQYQNLDFAPVTQSLQDMTMQPLDPLLTQLQRDKLMEDYYNFQFPGAICQNCGLSGCNCRACPAVMQSSIDGSWAQCCSRKHVRTAELAQHAMLHSAIITSEQQNLQSLLSNPDAPFPGDRKGYEMNGLKPGGDQPLSPDFTANPLEMSNAVQEMDFDEFVMADPDPPSSGCCCGGET